MGTHKHPWPGVTALIAALVAVIVAVAPAMALNKVGQPGENLAGKLTLVDVTDNPNVNRTTYSYQLTVTDPSILHVDESTLSLSHMAGVTGLGNAIGWRRLSFSDSTGTWQYARQLGFKNYSTFDIEADNTKTTLGTISYHLDADQDTFGTVEGPVALEVPLTFQISGTVFLDTDANGDFGDAEDGIPQVSLALVDGDGAEIATTVTDDGAYTGGNVYLGNYVFEQVPPGGYRVVVTDILGAVTDLTPTTPTNHTVVVACSDIREIDVGYAEASTQIHGRVFFDANRDGHSDDAIEMGFDQVEVTLTWQEGGQPQSETATTDSDGYYDFGTRAAGEYTVAVTADTKWGLFEYFDPTTSTSVGISLGSDDIRKDFGFYPNWCEINRGMRDGEITGNNKTIGFWKHNVCRALSGSTNGIQVTREELLAYLTAVVELQPFEEPFEFSGTDNHRLWKALWHLSPRMSGNCPLQKLDRQLLAAELNYVSGYNSSEPGLERAVIWYAEYVLNYDPGMAGFMAEEMDAWNNLGES